MLKTPIEQLLAAAGLPIAMADDIAIVDAADPVLATRYRIAAAGSAAIGASALGAANLWALKTGRRQKIVVNGRHATAAMQSSHYLLIDGVAPPKPFQGVTGFYQTKDQRWIFLHCSFLNLMETNFDVLGVTPSQENGAAAVAKWNAVELEEAIAAAGGCAAAVRSEAEWPLLPQAKAVAETPLIEITRIGDAPPEPLPQGDRPLSGIRALDLTRVLAGPTCARTLAEHGAEIMKISRPDLPDSGMFDLDTGHGKLSAFADFRKADDAAALCEMIRGADIFSQSYRPGALASHGYAPEELAAIRPGLIYVTLSAWGHTGPWASRRGYDTIVQCPTGMAYRPDNQKPAFLPVSIHDYVAGYLMAYGAMVALHKRATEGGSWLVRLSLAGVGHWIRSLGEVDPAAYADCGRTLPADEIETYLMNSQSPAGRLRHLAPAVSMSETPAYWALPAVPLGTHEPYWLPR